MFRFDSLKVKPAVDLQGGQQVSMSTGVASGGGGAVAKPGEPGYRGTVPNSEGYMKKVVELQRLFLKNDGKLVWQKRGIRDMPLYYALIGMTAIGVAGSMFELYRLGTKKN